MFKKIASAVVALLAVGLLPALRLAITAQATSYSATIQADSPAVYYRLGEASGSTAADASGNNRTGTYSGSVTLGTAGALIGDSDTAATFSGGMVQYAAGTGLPTGTSARTFEAWVNTTSTADQVVLSYGGNGNGYYCGYLESGLGLVAGDQVSFITGYDCNGGYTPMTFTAPRTISDGTWHLIAVSWDGTTVNAYLDGQSIGSQAFNRSLGTADSNGLVVGRLTTNGYATHGGIDEVAIYPSALSATQIGAHFDASANARPGAPSAVTAVAGANRATVSWTAASAASSAPVVAYLVTASLGGAATSSISAAATATSATIYGLKGGSSYTFTITAVNRFGIGTASGAAGATPTGPSTTYASTVQGDHPASYYRLDDGGSMGADSSGNGHTASYSGGSAGASGALGNDSGDPAWSAGGSGYLQNNQASGMPAGTSARTFEAWVQTTSTTDQALLAYGGAPASYCNNYESGLLLAGGNQVVFVTSYDCNGGYNGQRFTASSTIADGHWHLLDTTWDGSTVKAYLDGQSIGSSSYSTGSGSADSKGLELGRLTSGNQKLNGSLDEVAVYPTALTATQVSAHFNAAGDAVPTAPTGVTATAGAGSASVSWTAPSSGAVTGYSVNGTSAAGYTSSVTVPASATSANLGPLAGFQSYTFKVTALGITANGSASSPSSAVTVNPPPEPAGGPTAPFGNYLTIRSTGYDPAPAGTVKMVSGSSLAAASNWTVEGWFKSFGSWATTGSAAGIGYLDPSTGTLTAGIGISAGGTFSANYPGGSSNITLPSNPWCSTCWYHIAVSYDGSDVRAFVNGTQNLDLTVSGAGAPAGPGGLYDYSAIRSLAIDDLRISNVAQYTSSFTAPTSALGTTGAVLLYHFDDYPITRIGSFTVHANQHQTTGDYPGMFWDSANGNTAHIDTADTNGYDPAGIYLQYRFYSLGQGPTADELDASGSCWMCTHPPLYGDPINTVTGEFWQTADDLSIPGRGLAIDFNRTYSSNRASVDGPLGFGWSNSYGFSLSLDGSGNATVSQSTGAKTLFSWNSTTSAFSAAPRTIATLVKNGDGSYTLTQKDQSQMKFDSSGRLTAEVDPAGFTTSLAYNGSGQLSTVTDPAGRALTLNFTGTHITKIADPAGRSVSYGYDGSGNLASVTDLGGGVTSYSYDTSHELTNFKDAKCTAGSCPGTTNTYSGGQVTQQQDPLGRITKFSYSSDGVSSTTTITDPRNYQTQEEYLNGLLVSRTAALGTSLQATTTYQYDPVTLAQTAITDPLGRTTTLTYDSQGNLLTAVDPLGRTTTHGGYNSLNEPGTVIDPAGVTTTYSYNTTGHLTSKSTPLTGGGNAVTSYSYDTSQPGDLLTATDPENRVTTYTYNSDGDRVSSTDNAGDETTYAFDGVGRMTSSVSPLGNVTGGNPSQYTTGYTANAFGDVLTVTDPLSHVTTYAYDPNRNRTSVTDANNHTTSSAFDYDNELTLLTRPDSSTQGTTYDGDGNVTQQTDGLNHTTTYAYDALDRKTSVTDALGRVTGYGYDLVGDLTSMTDAAGAVTSYAYDAGNQLIQAAYQTAQPGTAGYQYDKDGRRTQMTDGTGTTGYQYDNLGRLTSSTDGSGATVGYVYDKSSLLTSIAYPASLGTVLRTYDAAGRLKTVSDWLSHQTTYSYDANSELTSIAYPNTVTATEVYDRAGHLTSIGDQQGSSSPFFSETYGRDAAGQLTSDGTSSFGYDTQNRLTSGGSQGYGYDAADRVTAINTTGGNQGALAYDNADQLSTDTITNGGTQVQKYTYAYDARGNRVSRTDASSNLASYGWDQANHLLSYSAGTTTGTYTYNGDGLRTSKTVNGGSETFTWDTAQGLPLIIKDGSTAYLTGLGGLPLEQISGSTVLYYHQDQLGSTRALTNSAGATAATTTYDAYGNLSSSTGTTANPFGFAGQYLDSESGLNYLRARFYDPATGGFAARDPLSVVTRQPYVYVHDSPINGGDPSGLWCAGWTAGGVGFGGSEGGSTEWAVGYCGNGDLYAARTTGGYKAADGNGIWGGYVTAGFGVQASGSATCAADLGKGFHRNFAGAGVGPYSASLSSSTGTGVNGNPVDVEEASYPAGKYAPPSIGGGAGLISYNTYTDVYRTNWVTSEVNNPLVSAAQAAHSIATWASGW
ncbi:MAG TPA: LamG-like jellyroll fold domain-containing protein [Candidatus Dormibacteraeota bacterium]|nr:LamG-like jellyroll fold domain-containing protein [Candidatus Dormibacteraeota bacterium]